MEEREDFRNKKIKIEKVSEEDYCNECDNMGCADFSDCTIKSEETTVEIVDDEELDPVSEFRAERKDKRKVLGSGERKILFHVLESCKKERQFNRPLVPLNQAYKRAAFLTGVSLSTFNRIQKEHRSGESNGSTTPKKKIERPTWKTILQDQDFAVIRREISNFYVRKKEFPTLVKLVAAIKQKLPERFTYGKSTMLTILRYLGYRYHKTESGKRVLIENPKSVARRAKYLSKLKACREEGRQIFYLGEITVAENMTLKKCWKSKRIQSTKASSSSDERFMIADIGSDEGFVPGARLVFQSGAEVGDYHGDMDAENFERWLREYVLPNLPPNSVVVMDNAPYHSIESDRAPTKFSTKTETVDWLTSKGVSADPRLRKWQLYEMVQQLRPKGKCFKADELFIIQGHTVLRLPASMCELNPIELVWSKIETIFREANVTRAVSLDDRQRAIAAAFNSITAEDWSGYCRDVRTVEDDFLKIDGIVESMVEKMGPLAIKSRVVSSDDSNSESDSSGSESE